jgi:ferritin-like metal-binding protein YciE
VRWENLEDLYVQELRDLYAAQTRLVELWPRLGEAAENAELKKFCEAHGSDSGSQRARIVTICEQLNVAPDGVNCAAIVGLEKEAAAIMEVDGDAAARDAGLIAVGNRIEHYEMAAFGAARTHARLLGHEGQAKLLQDSLDEAGRADRALTSLAEKVNARAV